MEGGLHPLLNCRKMQNVIDNTWNSMKGKTSSFKLQVCTQLTLMQLEWHGRGNTSSLTLELIVKYRLTHLEKHVSR